MVEDDTKKEDTNICITILKQVFLFVFHCICPIGVIKALLDETKILFDALSAINKALLYFVTVLCFLGYAYILLLIIKPLLLKLNLSNIIDNIADGSWKHLLSLYGLHVCGIIAGYWIDQSKRNHWNSCIVTCINLGAFFIFLTIVRHYYIPLIKSLYSFRSEILPILLFELFIASCIYYGIKVFYGDKIKEIKDKIVNSDQSNTKTLQGIVDTLIKDINNKIPNIQKLENTINNLSDEMDKTLKLNDDMRFKLLPYYKNYNHLFYTNPNIKSRYYLLKLFLGNTVDVEKIRQQRINVSFDIVEDILTNVPHINIFYCQHIDNQVREKIETSLLKGINRHTKYYAKSRHSIILNSHLHHDYQTEQYCKKVSQSKSDDSTSHATPTVYLNISHNQKCIICNNLNKSKIVMYIVALEQSLIGYICEIKITFSKESGEDILSGLNTNIIKLGKYTNIEDIETP